MTDLRPVEPLDPKRHRVADFNCGQPRLDRWLRAYAGQSQRRDVARTFVTANSELRVAGYFTLVAGQVEHANSSDAVRRGVSRHFPIPVCLIARLAIDEPWQGRGLGSGLLREALRRTVGAGDQLGIRAVVVQAVDEEAAGFYRQYGFQPATADGLSLMMPLTVVRSSLPNKG